MNRRVPCSTSGWSTISSMWKITKYTYNTTNSFPIYCIIKSYSKPAASEVLTCYIKQCDQPPWTSYFVKQNSVINDQFGQSHFNWQVGNSNYHILRIGCFPYIKYHCSRRPFEDLSVEDRLFRLLKNINLGIPCLAYGLAAKLLIKHTEEVHTSKGTTLIYFLYKEDVGSEH